MTFSSIGHIMLSISPTLFHMIKNGLYTCTIKYDKSIIHFYEQGREDCRVCNDNYTCSNGVLL